MFTRHAFIGMLGALLLSACQQNKDYPVFFLTEAGGGEPGRAFIVTYGGKHYNRMPALALKHCSKFRSFLNPDGSYGVVLYVKDEYRNRLYTTTLQHQGRNLLPVVNGLAFEPTLIDTGITDGKLVIWNGLNGYDLKMFGKHLEPMEPEIEEKRYLDKNPRPLPKPSKKKSKEGDAGLQDFLELESGTGQ